MPRVVVAGSDNDPFFAVIDFTEPENPVVTRVAPDPTFPFAACRVAINASHVAVGDPEGGDIRLLDVSNPSSPVTLGFVRTDLLGIGAIAIRGSQLAVGELAAANSARVLLIDFSSAANPVVIGTALTPFAATNTLNAQGKDTLVGAVFCVVFGSDNEVLASGSSEPEILRIDFADPANPVLTNLTQTMLAGAPAIDFSTGNIAAGDGDGSHVNVFRSADFTLLTSFTSKLFPVTSVAMSETFVLAGSSQDVVVSCIPLDGSPVQTVQANLGIGLVTAISGSVGACGGLDSPFVVLVDLGANPPSLLGAPADAQFEAMNSVGISTFGSLAAPGTGGSGTVGGSGGNPGQGGTGAGVILPQPHFSVRPLSLRTFMESQKLDPAAGLRVIRPLVTSITEFMLE